jgi:HAE1 family hydrophobic/amphiphilic exporter-1
MADITKRPIYERHTGLSALHMIHKWSIEHPMIVLAFYFGVVVMAIIAITGFMPRRFMPYVESPLIGVVTMMPGLSAEEMELYYSKPIEEQMTNIRNVRYIRSTSQDGFSIVSLEFTYGIDMKKALFDVQTLMNVVQSTLPAASANVKPSWVLPIDPLNIPVLSLSLRGEGWDPVKLREFADNTVVARIKQGADDVYSVVPFGGYRRQLQVICDKEKLAAYGLSITDVSAAIDKYNVSRPGGTLTSGTSENIVRFDTRAVDSQMVANYPVGSYAAPAAPDSVATGPAQSPRIVYVKDVARVEDTHWERRSAYDFVKHDPGAQGEIVPSLEVAVLQNPEASSWKVIRSVNKVLRQLEHENPGITFDVAYDNSHFVDILFHNMFEELGIAILLCGIAVFLFLGEWRGTLIAMTTIPMSLAIAILALLPMGMTLNSGTLIGLLLSIGRLVDDTIIDIHSVERHLRMGKDPKTATIDGIAEVRLAVIASTVMILLALSPLLFCGGIVELMFRELVWPLMLGLLASMLVSFTLTALMCANLLRPEAARAAEKRLLLWRWVINPFQNLLDRMERGYARTIAWMLKNRFANLTRILATVVIGFGFYHFIGSEMMPLADVGQAYGSLEMSSDTSFEGTERAVHAVEQIMLKYPEIQRVSTEIGSESAFESTGTYYTGYAVPAVNAATFMMTLSDMTERKRDIWQVIDGVQEEAMRTIPGIRRFQIKEMGSDVMASSQAPIALIVYGADLNLLSRMGEKVLAIGKQHHLIQAGTDWSMDKPDYEVKVNPARAQELGLSVDAISQQAYYALRGGLTNEFYRLPNIRQNTVLVRYEADQRRNAVDLSHIYITGPGGRSVPLDSLATVTLRQSPSLVTHDGLRRVITILGYYRRSGKPSMDLGMDIQMQAMSDINFPPGYGIETRGDMTQMMDSFRRLLSGLMLAVVFILLILVAQFRGFLQPLQMMFSLPLELAGVFFMLWLTHTSFSTVSVMAIIVLTGMDITTAILLVDMIMRYRDRGIERDEAVMDACPQRLRPILMTSVITILVMIPVAFFPKTGMDAYSAVGVVLIGGLLIGTILSLFDIPIMHTYVDDLIRILHRTFLRRDWKWPVTVHEEIPHENEPPPDPST